MKRRHLILLGVILLIGVTLAFYVRWTWDIQQRFARAIEGCDRVVVESWGQNWDTMKKFTDTHQIKGAEKVASFASRIKVFRKRAPCKCMGNPRLRFFQGETQIAMFGLDHGDSLKGLDGSAAGYTLTASSRSAVIQWLRDEGYAAIDAILRDGIIQVGSPPEINLNRNND